jgi:DNA recombination protein RmuC
MEIAAALLVAAALVVAAFLLRRPAAPTSDPAALQALESVSRHLGQLQGELTRLAQANAELRQDVQRGREASVLQLAETAQGIRGELSQAQRALAEVKALEHGRARQMEAAAEGIKRLETVVAGSATRGAAGENILARALAQLPPDLIEINVAFGNKIVEYALRLPGGRYLPIDSKWTSLAAVERLAVVEDPAERRKLIEGIARDVRSRVREMTKYLDPERTLALALLAVPDAVYVAAPEAHGEGYREGVLVVPYSMALPYVLALYRLVLRFGASVDTDQLAAHVRALAENLRRMDEELEGRLSKGLVQIQNARDALRDQVASAQRTADRLVRDADPEEEEPARRAPLALFPEMAAKR